MVFPWGEEAYGVGMWNGLWRLGRWYSLWLHSHWMTRKGWHFGMIGGAKKALDVDLSLLTLLLLILRSARWQICGRLWWRGWNPPWLETKPFIDVHSLSLISFLLWLATTWGSSYSFGIFCCHFFFMGVWYLLVFCE